MVQQQPDDVDVAAGRGERERRVVGHVAVLLVGAAAEDELHHLVAAAAAGQRQRRVLRALRLRLDVRAVVQQDLHDLLVPRRRGQDQGSEALLI